MTKNIKETHKSQILEETTIDTAATMTEKTGEPLIFFKTTKQDDSSSFRPFQKSELTTGWGVDTELSSQDDIPSSIVRIYPTVTAIISKAMDNKTAAVVIDFIIRCIGKRRCRFNMMERDEEFQFAMTSLAGKNS
ncbi:Hypothetical predicted protein [Mytilus galloprovincialis]|uniref:Uncharacterized protein n=1 Tax=Mytilus galloprovincialis TaxID=29158 RepID=A0A8B6BPQ8_MYTGA|nr:Hypothetical predicted protein [Mytilus galloprovincialis]VDI61156.1 Hypothetical predicted protein [Mytilus galloprovincialis]